MKTTDLARAAASTETTVRVEDLSRVSHPHPSISSRSSTREVRRTMDDSVVVVVVRASSARRRLARDPVASVIIIRARAGGGLIRRS